jgi:phage gp29-like protein
MTKSTNRAARLSTLLPLADAGNAFADHYPVPISLGAAGNQVTDYYWMCIDAMLQDEEIAADFELRHATSIMTPYTVEGSASDIAFVNDMLAELELDVLMEHCLYHADYGFNPVELDWVEDGGLIRPVLSERRHPRSFRWGKDGKLLYSASGGTGFDFKAVPEGKVIPVVRNGSREKPYGESVLEPAWPVWQTKWAHVEQLERLAQKYSVPTSIALVDSTNATEASLANISANMAAIDGGGSVALSGVKEVVQLTASGKATELMNVIKDYNNSLAKLITGQTLTNGTQKYGSRSLGEVQERAALRIMVNDARTVYAALNRTLLKWVFALNNRPGSVQLKFDKKRFNAELAVLQGNGGAALLNFADDRDDKPLSRARRLCF